MQDDGPLLSKALQEGMIDQSNWIATGFVAGKCKPEVLKAQQELLDACNDIMIEQERRDRWCNNFDCCAKKFLWFLDTGEEVVCLS
jgi:hypothetical protein